MQESYSRENIHQLADQLRERSRKPVVESGGITQLKKEKCVRAWGFIVKAVMKELSTDKDLRKIVVKFITRPLCEDLANLFLQEAAHQSARIHRLYGRYHQDLLLLAGAPVPDEAFAKDVRTTSAPFSIDKLLTYVDLDNEEIRNKFGQELEGYLEKPPTKGGVTPDEKRLVLLRYPLARDVKLLALAAVWAENMPELTPSDERGILRSDPKEMNGVEVKCDEHFAEELSFLLDPVRWENRRQLKDRVYRFSVNGKHYILKEQKTNRHSDTMNKGHVPTLTSSEEFSVAREFYEKGYLVGENLEISWERPIGSVTFSDGYQFVVFEWQEGLVEGEDQEDKIKAFIDRNWSSFEKEYQEMCAALPIYLRDPSIANEMKMLIRDSDEMGWDVSRQISRDMFIDAKARYYFDMAKLLLEQTTEKMGYENKDQQQPVFRLIEGKDRVALQAFGYDFEYFSKQISTSKKPQKEDMFEHRRHALLPLPFLAYFALRQMQPAQSYHQV